MFNVLFALFHNVDKEFAPDRVNNFDLFSLQASVFDSQYFELPRRVFNDGLNWVKIVRMEFDGNLSDDFYP